MKILDKIKGLLRKEERFFGFVPNDEHEKDPRNLRYEDIAPMGAITIPESGDTEDRPWGLNQGHSSSCT